jgi:hypothetical protein
LNKIAHRHSHKTSTAKSSKENPAAITTGFVSSLTAPDEAPFSFLSPIAVDQRLSTGT